MGRGQGLALGLFALGLLIAAAVTLLGGDDEAAAPQVVSLDTPDERGPDEIAPARPAEAAPRALLVAEPVPAPAVTAAPAAEVAPDEAPDAAPLELTVVHASGLPARGATVGLYDGEQLLGDGVTDAQGRWHHPGHDGPAELFVLGVSLQPGRLELPLARGRHELRLAPGAWLSGVVRINGAPPGEPFPLAIDGAPSARGALSGRQQFPPPARKPGHVNIYMKGGFVTDAAGHFHVSGLADGAQVSLRWPWTYDLDPFEPTPFPVTAPADDVVLSLVRPSLVKGRLLREDGSPAGDAQVRTSLALSNGETTQTDSYGDVPVAADGRFVIALHNVLDRKDRPVPPETVEVGLELMARDDQGRTLSLTRPGLALALDHDLGDLLLQTPVSMRLSLHDPAGRPVPDASVRLETGLKRATVLHSDAEGQVTLAREDKDLGWATVIAPGFEALRVALPDETLEQPLPVLMQPGCVVNMTLRGPWDGGHGSDDALAGWRFHVRVETLGLAFADALLPVLPGRALEVGPDPLRPRDPNVRGRGTDVYETGVRHDWWTPEPALSVDGLRSGHPLAFSVFIADAPESFGEPPEGPVWERAELRLGQGEQLQLDVDLRHLLPAR